jgi:hypothetical protein
MLVIRVSTIEFINNYLLNSQLALYIDHFVYILHFFIKMISY